MAKTVQRLVVTVLTIRCVYLRQDFVSMDARLVLKA